VYFASCSCDAVSLFKLLTEKFCSKITKKTILDEWDNTALQDILPDNYRNKLNLMPQLHRIEEMHMVGEWNP
jgi:hypothetical protein